MTGITTLWLSGAKARPYLDMAASSETLLPVARATRNKVFISKLLSVFVEFLNCGCSNMERTLFGFQAGMIHFWGGLVRN